MAAMCMAVELSAESLSQAALHCLRGLDLMVREDGLCGAVVAVRGSLPCFCGEDTFQRLAALPRLLPPRQGVPMPWSPEFKAASRWRLLRSGVSPAGLFRACFACRPRAAGGGSGEQEPGQRRAAALLDPGVLAWLSRPGTAITSRLPSAAGAGALSVSAGPPPGPSLPSLPRMPSPGGAGGPENEAATGGGAEVPPARYPSLPQPAPVEAEKQITAGRQRAQQEQPPPVRSEPLAAGSSPTLSSHFSCDAAAAAVAASITGASAWSFSAHEATAVQQQQELLPPHDSVQLQRWAVSEGSEALLQVLHKPSSGRNGRPSSAPLAVATAGTAWQLQRLGRSGGTRPPSGMVDTAGLLAVPSAAANTHPPLYPYPGHSSQSLPSLRPSPVASAGGLLPDRIANGREGLSPWGGTRAALYKEEALAVAGFEGDARYSAGEKAEAAVILDILARQVGGTGWRVRVACFC